jgi:hypothetical protein
MSLFRRLITWLLDLPFRGEFERECAKWREFDAKWRAECEQHYSEACEQAKIRMQDTKGQ